MNGKGGDLGQGARCEDGMGLRIHQIAKEFEGGPSAGRPSAFTERYKQESGQMRTVGPFPVCIWEQGIPARMNSEIQNFKDSLGFISSIDFLPNI